MSSAPKKSWIIFLFLPIPFLFYWYTCLPSIGLGDSVLFIHAIKQLKISTWVNNHNLTTIWGWLFQFLPFGDIAYRGNLSCVFSGGLAVCIFYLALYSLYRCFATTLIASLFLMVSHSFWWHNTDLADYSMNGLFASVFIYLYVRLHVTDHVKYLYAIFFTCGLALFQHYLLGSFLIGAAAALLCRLCQRKEKPWPLIWTSAGFFLIGLIPWLLTFLYDVSLSHSVTQTLSGCLGGPFKGLFFKQPLWNGLKEYLTLVFIQFPSPYIAAIVLGVYFNFKAWKISPCSIGLLFSFLPNVYFDLGLNSWAVFAQLLPTFIIQGFWASFVIHWAVNHPRVSRSSLLRWSLTGLAALSFVWTIYFYANLSRWGEDPKNIWHSRYNNSYTINSYHLNEFLANPNKRDYNDIASFCNLILDNLASGSQFWDSDSRLYFQLAEYYQKYYHKRLDLDFRLINSFGFDNWGADKNTFYNEIKSAYLNGKDFFLCSLGHPAASLLAKTPDKMKYEFRKYWLNNQWWVYKLLTVKDQNSEERTLWDKWDFLPSDKPVLINLTLKNLLDFREGEVLLQEDMATFGPYWKGENQVFFSPARQGAQIGFLLKFKEAFTGDLTLSMTTAFDAGLVDVLLNDALLTKTPINLYSAGVFNKEFELTDVHFEKGNNVLSIRIAGKDDRSSDKKLGVDTIGINPLH